MGYRKKIISKVGLDVFKGMDIFTLSVPLIYHLHKSGMVMLKAIAI